ncbi:MAG: Rieske (2Fe-2S) protein [Candidatus Baltobacteraceae bacterium]
MSNVRERAIAAALLLTIAGSGGFTAAFWMHASTQVLGGCLAAAFFGLALAMLGWSRWIVPFEQVTDLRDTYPQPVQERALQGESFDHGIAAIGRKPFLLRMLYVALGSLGVAALFPIGSLGPPPGESLFHSKWRRGVRLQRPDGAFVKASDMNVDSVVTVFPENNIGDYNSMAVLIRLPEGVGSNTAQGLIAYSKACTHAGCPVALYRAKDHRLVCPCHQSAFDAADGAKVLAGPADHPLPQLPIEIRDDGFVRATGDFPAPPGPGFWQES